MRSATLIWDAKPHADQAERKIRHGYHQNFGLKSIATR
jgi:cation transport regulator ChaC